MVTRPSRGGIAFGVAGGLPDNLARNAASVLRPARPFHTQFEVRTRSWVNAASNARANSVNSREFARVRAGARCHAVRPDCG